MCGISGFWFKSDVPEAAQQWLKDSGPQAISAARPPGGQVSGLGLERKLALVRVGSEGVGRLQALVSAAGPCGDGRLRPLRLHRRAVLHLAGRVQAFRRVLAGT